MSSFERLTDSKIFSVQPQGVKIDTATRPTTLDRFDEHYPSTISLD